ncbi:MAG: AAA family ATPase, partial [Alphaproteobacteria bacterium]|nr:AAA family ATPase [Alphaproteobacteria bacterium]
DYCLPDSGAGSKNNFFIISGCSGSGKSSILQELSDRGFKVINETGRQVVKEQILIKGDALPWKDWMKFVELTISRTMYQYNILKDEEEIVFFDRSIIDQISWEHLNIKVPDHFINAANEYRFNDNVFISEPWKEIFKNFSIRKIRKLHLYLEHLDYPVTYFLYINMILGKKFFFILFLRFDSFRFLKVLSVCFDIFFERFCLIFFFQGRRSLFRNTN